MKEIVNDLLIAYTDLMLDGSGGEEEVCGEVAAFVIECAISTDHEVRREEKCGF